MSLEQQSHRLKSTQSNLARMQTAALPAVNKLIGMIGQHNLKNKLILSFVIAACLAVLLYQYGVISLANTLTQ